MKFCEVLLTALVHVVAMVVGVAMLSEGGTNDATRWRHRDDAPHSSHTNTQPQTTRPTPAHTVLTVSKWAAPRPGPVTRIVTRPPVCPVSRLGLQTIPQFSQSRSRVLARAF